MICFSFLLVFRQRMGHTTRNQLHVDVWLLLLFRNSKESAVCSSVAARARDNICAHDVSQYSQSQLHTHSHTDYKKHRQHIELSVRSNRSDYLPHKNISFSVSVSRKFSVLLVRYLIIVSSYRVSCHRAAVYGVCSSLEFFRDFHLSCRLDKKRCSH